MLETVRTTSPPIFITALITVLGLLSLCLHDTEAGLTRIIGLRELGLYSAAGVSIASLLTVTLIPALLTLMRPPAWQEQTFSLAVNSALRRLGRVAIQYRRGIISTSLLMTAVAMWQISFLRVDLNFLSFFREDNSIRQATEVMNLYFGNTIFYVVIDGYKLDSLRQRDALRRSETCSFISTPSLE